MACEMLPHRTLADIARLTLHLSPVHNSAGTTAQSLQHAMLLPLPSSWLIIFHCL